MNIMNKTYWTTVNFLFSVIFLKQCIKVIFLYKVIMLSHDYSQSNSMRSFTCTPPVPFNITLNSCFMENEDFE